MKAIFVISFFAILSVFTALRLPNNDVEMLDVRATNEKYILDQPSKLLKTQTLLDSFVQRQESVLDDLRERRFSKLRDATFLVMVLQQGLGNIMAEIVSSIVLAMATNRTLLFAPNMKFDCREIISSEICNWIKPKELATPEMKTLNLFAWLPSHSCKDLNSLLCSDNIFNSTETYLGATSGGQYVAPLVLSHNLIPQKLVDEFKLADGRISPYTVLLQRFFKIPAKLTTQVQNYGSAYGLTSAVRAAKNPYFNICVNLRCNSKKKRALAMTCIDSIRGSLNSSRSHIHLFTMHETHRQALKNKYQSEVTWATADSPAGMIQISSTFTSAAIDASLMSQCDALLFSPGSTFTTIPHAMNPHILGIPDTEWGPQCGHKLLHASDATARAAPTEPYSDIFRHDLCGLKQKSGAGTCGSIRADFLENPYGDVPCCGYICQQD